MTSSKIWDTSPISVDGPLGWDSNVTAMRGQKYCPWWLTFLDPSTGQVFDFGNKCRSWSHRPCAEKRAVRLLAMAVAWEAARKLGSGPPHESKWGTAIEKPDGVDLDAWNAVVKEVAEELTDTAEAN